MELRLTGIAEELIARLRAAEENEARSILDAAGREAAIASGLVEAAERVRDGAADKENEYLLFSQFKESACRNDPGLQMVGGTIHWRLGTDLREVSRERGVSALVLRSFVLGYAKELFETLFDSFLEIEIVDAPSAAEGEIELTIAVYDAQGHWIDALLASTHTLDQGTAGMLLEACGRACGRAHGLAEQARKIRDSLEDKDDVAALFNLYRVRAYGNSPRLYKEGEVIFLEYHACGCPIVARGKITDPAFCQCTTGYTKERFETLFGRPVHVQLLESILRGDPRCRQAITLL